MTLSADGAPSEKTDEAGVAGGITVLVLAVPLLLVSALAFYSGRLAQADNHLSWAATSAARAGANCRIPEADRPCTFREAALTIEKTARAILLENRRLYCQNSNSTGMRVEYQDQDGGLIYAYVIGSLLLNGRYWPDRGGEIPAANDPDAADENPQSDANFDPFQARNLRRDFNGNELFLESRVGVIQKKVSDNLATPEDETRAEETASNPAAFETSMSAPGAAVRRIAVNLICDFAGGATGLLSRASTREASAIAVVPAAEAN